jgi:hypothetical protein
MAIRSGQNFRNGSGQNYRNPQNEFWKVFSPFELDADRVRVFYQPHGVTVPVESLSEATLVLGGRPAAQFIAEEIQPGLRAL